MALQQWQGLVELPGAGGLSMNICFGNICIYIYCLFVFFLCVCVRLLYVLFDQKMVHT